MDIGIAVHGGAGNHEAVEELNQKAEELSQNGIEKLEKGWTAMDVVEETVNKLESDERFNAGKGSKLHLDGIPRPEAGIMNSKREIGAVTGLTGIEHPTSVAKIILKEINNNMLGAPYSTQFAKQHDFEKTDLVTDERFQQWEAVKDQLTDDKPMYRQLEELKKLDDSENHGTVGCVARDKNGELCASTSTGGRIYQAPGRIGDSPLVGSGFICTENVAVSTTGVGESIMKTQLSRTVVEKYEDSNLDEALTEALDELSRLTNGHAGIIAVDNTGYWSADYNSRDMVYSGKTSSF